MSSVSEELDSKIRTTAGNRCGYCLAPQKLLSYKLEIEHIHPKAKGGKDKENNLWLACRQCNLYKGIKTHGQDLISLERVKIFNPRQQNWSEHFVWDERDTRIIGKTPVGRVTVSILQLNNELQKTAREFWKLTGIFPPKN
ncbi:MAG: HNH endonuclease [Aridibacter sp.]